MSWVLGLPCWLFIGRNMATTTIVSVRWNESSNWRNNISMWVGTRRSFFSRHCTELGRCRFARYARPIASCESKETPTMIRPSFCVFVLLTKREVQLVDGRQLERRNKNSNTATKWAHPPPCDRDKDCKCISVDRRAQCCWWLKCQQRFAALAMPHWQPKQRRSSWHCHYSTHQLDLTKQNEKATNKSWCLQRAETTEVGDKSVQAEIAACSASRSFIEPRSFKTNHFKQRTI